MRCKRQPCLENLQGRKKKSGAATDALTEITVRYRHAHPTATIATPCRSVRRQGVALCSDPSTLTGK